MAEKSMIVRPTSSGDMNGATVYPSDVTEENAYQLINESEADDDATYIEVAATVSGFAVLFEKPQITTIVGVKLHCRVDSQGTSKAFDAQLFAIPSEDSTLTSISADGLDLGPATTGWGNYAIDYSGATTFIEALNNSEYTQIQATCFPGSKPNGSKTTAVSTKYTQVYLELIYDDGEATTTPLYLRENGAWVAVEGTVYQKVNGAWVTSSADVFQDGDTYQLVVV